MKACMSLFAAVVFALILGPVSLDKGADGNGPRAILWWAESQAATDTIVVKRATGEGNSSAAHGKSGSPGSRLTPQEIRQLLASHNEARMDVGLAGVVWSDRLAVYAQEWADHLASTSRRMEHRPHSGRWKQEHGENLFAGTAGYYGVADAVAVWVKEKSAYDGGAVEQSNLHAYGHYTQLVWKNTKRIGCAKVECAGNVIIVCNYDPPGNVLGQTPY